MTSPVHLISSNAQQQSIMLMFICSLFVLIWQMMRYFCFAFIASFLIKSTTEIDVSLLGRPSNTHIASTTKASVACANFQRKNCCLFCSCGHFWIETSLNFAPLQFRREEIQPSLITKSEMWIYTQIIATNTHALNIFIDLQHVKSLTRFCFVCILWWERNVCRMFTLSVSRTKNQNSIVNFWS